MEIKAAVLRTLTSIIHLDRNPRYKQFKIKISKALSVFPLTFVLCHGCI